MQLTLNRIKITQLKDGRESFCIEAMDGEDYTLVDLQDTAITGVAILRAFLREVDEGVHDDTAVSMATGLNDSVLDVYCDGERLSKDEIDEVKADFNSGATL